MSDTSDVARVRRNKQEVDEVKILQAAVALEQARREQPDIWSDESLVSVRIATFNRPELLVERAIASALRQTHKNLEVVVVGDGATPETDAAMAKLTLAEPRVRYQNLPARPSYAQFPRFFWATAGCDAANLAIELCQEAWIAPLDDDDEFSDDHVEVLLAAARAQKLEMVYGQVLMADGESWRPHGKAPLSRSHVCHNGVMYSRRLSMLRYDKLSFLDDDPADWNMWKRMEALGARIGFVEKVVGKHWPERSSLPPEERGRLFARVATPDELIADVVRADGQALLEMA